MYILAEGCSCPRAKPAKGNVVMTLGSWGSPEHVELSPAIGFRSQRETWKMLYFGIRVGSRIGKATRYFPTSKVSTFFSSSSSFTCRGVFTSSHVPSRKGKGRPRTSRCDARVTVCSIVGGTVTTISLTTGGFFAGSSSSSSKPTLTSVGRPGCEALQMSSNALTVMPCWTLLPLTSIAASTTLLSGVYTRTRKMLPPASSMASGGVAVTVKACWPGGIGRAITRSKRPCLGWLLQVMSPSKATLRKKSPSHMMTTLLG
mmetsp:Transcript_28377/g.79381  ORF Transcript_28377/g.79381 Transcript_28377/m.79381 type:complete len:259 (-) Transcript_28377:85-861(-)